MRLPSGSKISRVWSEILAVLPNEVEPSKENSVLVEPISGDCLMMATGSERRRSKSSEMVLFWLSVVERVTV